MFVFIHCTKEAEPQLEQRVATLYVLTEEIKVNSMKKADGISLFMWDSGDLPVKCIKVDSQLLESGEQIPGVPAMF